MPLPEYVYHLAEASNWPAIERRGLLPAEELIRSACPDNASRERLLRQHRPAHTILPSGAHLRDQGPMPPGALASCLIGLTPAQWYAIINAHVFFWLDAARLNRQRVACGARAQVVAVVRTARLLESVADRVFLTPFNVGYALRRPARRSVATLVPYRVWRSSAWLSETQAVGSKPRPPGHPPAELLVRGSILQFMTLVRAVIPLPPGATFVPKAF